MTALSATRPRTGPRSGRGLAILFALAVVLWTCITYTINNSLPISAPNGHAVERHGSDAITAVEWVDAHPATRKRIDCPNGRPIWYDMLPDGRVAVVVTTAGAWEVARNITAMILNQKHFDRFVRGCGGEPPLVPVVIPRGKSQRTE